MKNKKSSQIRFMFFAIMVMIALFAYMLIMISSIQGNARVINYTGIIRGASQRLVKNELYGMKDDEEILRLDKILIGLKTGESEFQLKALNNSTYQESLDHLMVEWDQLKNAIYDFRTDEKKKSKLYMESEAYFHLADDTVNHAEMYDQELTRKLEYLEVLIIINISLILFSLLSEFAGEVRENRKLKSIAFTDPNTGLPNKRSCELRLSQKHDFESENVCCFMFDLNNLKAVNDSLGHAAGDILINSFAQVLRLSAPAHMFTGRLGGDEFIGVCEDMTQGEIQDFMDRLYEETRISNSRQVSSGIELSFASGYASSVRYPHLTMRELMAVADEMMYKNKAAKKKADKRTIS